MPALYGDIPTLRAFSIDNLAYHCVPMICKKTKYPVKVKILLCTTASLLLLCGTVQYIRTSAISPKIAVDIASIPQGAYEQITLEYEGITDEEICRIYASDVAYWNKVDSIMCGD